MIGVVASSEERLSSLPGFGLLVDLHFYFISPLFEKKIIRSDRY